MITFQQAMKLAKEFSDAHGAVAPGIYYRPSAPIDASDCYYFNFELTDKHGNPPQEVFGGTPGFTIDKASGEAKIVSWTKYNALKNNPPA